MTVTPNETVTAAPVGQLQLPLRLRQLIYEYSNSLTAFAGCSHTICALALPALGRGSPAQIALQGCRAGHMERCWILDELAVMKTTDSYVRLHFHTFVVANSGRGQRSRHDGQLRWQRYAGSATGCPGTDRVAGRITPSTNGARQLSIPRMVRAMMRGVCIRPRGSDVCSEQGSATSNASNTTTQISM